jgi:hypothetical protein
MGGCLVGWETLRLRTQGGWGLWRLDFCLRRNDKGGGGRCPPYTAEPECGIFAPDHPKKEIISVFFTVNVVQCAVLFFASPFLDCFVSIVPRKGSNL